MQPDEAITVTEIGDLTAVEGQFLWSPADSEARRTLALDGLVAAGALNERDRFALNKSPANITPLDQAISALALATEDEIAQAFAWIFRCPRLDSRQSFDISLGRTLAFSFLRKRRVAPLRFVNGVLEVAVSDPTNLTGLHGCGFACEANVAPLIATHTEIEEILDRLQSSDVEQADSASDADENFDSVLDADRLRDMASAEPAVRLCNRLIADAVKLRASDIHLEPEERRYRIRLRIDGVLIERESVTVRQGVSAISRLKILSNLDIAERRRPQDGRFTFPVKGRPVDLRISAAPNVFGESVALRILERDNVELNLTALGFDESAASRLHSLCERPNGVILLTGPTGSGKTTTLYALLQRLAKTDRKILTIEDPVEYAIEGVAQTQANPAIGLDFSSALRSFLRHDPDVIMVGELRDLETARTAIQAALTGHLVLSTLHTNDAPSAVTRLVDMGVDDYLVASTLLAAVGQRLVRRLCRFCGGVGPRDMEKSACEACGGVGFHGRVAIAEIFEVNEALKPQIRKGVMANSLRDAARVAGFRTMAEDGAAKIEAGVTTPAEVRRAIIL